MAPKQASSESASDSGAKRHRTFLAILPTVVLALCMGAGSAVFWTFGRSHAESTAGLSNTASLLLWCAVGAAGVAGALSGDLSQRLGFQRAWGLASVVLALSIGGVAASPPLLPPTGTTFVTLGLLFGASYVVLCGLQITGAALAWPESLGAGTAITFTAIAAGQAVGAASAGLVIDAAGSTVAFVCGALVCAAGGVAALLMPFGRRRATLYP